MDAKVDEAGHGQSMTRCRNHSPRRRSPYRSQSRPSAESAAIVRSLRWGLEEIPTLGLVTSAALEITAVEPARGRQIGLFAPDGAHAEEAISVAQFLRTRLGPAVVLQPRIVDADARLPERAAEWEEVVR